MAFPIVGISPSKAKAIVFVFEGLINWGAISGALLLLATMVGKASCNTRDLFAYQALARVPTVVTAVFAMLPGYRRYASHLAFDHIGGLSRLTLQTGDAFFFWLVVLVMLVAMLVLLEVIVRL